MALKLLRDGVPSANIVANNPGAQDNWNFFYANFSNHIMS